MVEPIDDLKFGEIAVLEKLVTPADIRETLRLQEEGRDGDGPFRHKIGTILVRRGLITRDDAQRVLQIQKAPNPIEGYKILDRIGAGGMGTVYRALQLSLRREVALKVLDGRFTENDRYRKRFTREAGLLAMLRHPNLVACFDRGESRGNLFMAVEYVGGRDLKRILEENGPISEEKTLELAIQMAEAMIHYQAQGVLHRDFKPDNIILDEKNWSAKLTDLGLALRLEEPERLTTDGRTLGTPLYISPELAKGTRDVDIRSDIYSLGATIYHALTGRPPFTGQSVADIIRKHARDPVPSIREKCPAINPAFAAVIDKMLEKLPRNRWDSPEQMLQALREVKDGGAKVEAAPRTARSSGTIRVGGGTSSSSSSIRGVTTGRTPPRGVTPPRGLSPASGSHSARTARSGGAVTVRRPRNNTVPVFAALAACAGVAFVLILAVAASGGSDARGGAAAEETATDAPSALRAADAFARAKPDDLESIAKRYVRVAERFPSSDEGRRARDVVERLASREVGRLERRIGQLVEEGRVREAIAKIDAFPAALETGDVKAHLARLREDVGPGDEGHDGAFADGDGRD